MPPPTKKQDYTTRRGGFKSRGGDATIEVEQVNPVVLGSKTSIWVGEYSPNRNRKADK